MPLFILGVTGLLNRYGALIHQLKTGEFLWVQRDLEIDTELRCTSKGKRFLGVWRDLEIVTELRYTNKDKKFLRV